MQTTGYGSDAAGNRTSIADVLGTSVFAFDALSQMSSQYPPSVSGPTTLTYNGDGQRTRKAPDGESAINFIYDQRNLLQEVDDDDETLRTYTMSGGDGYGDLISEYQQSGGGGEYYHQFDANANSNAIIDDSCTVAQKYRYQAFGLPIPFDGTGTFGGSSLLWGGQKGYYFDADTQLYLLGAGTTGREYDPSTGKFLSEDPTRYAAGDTNLQRYVGNNPVNLVDPNGHDGPVNQIDPEGLKPKSVNSTDVWNAAKAEFRKKYRSYDIIGKDYHEGRVGIYRVENLKDVPLVAMWNLEVSGTQEFWMARDDTVGEAVTELYNKMVKDYAKSGISVEDKRSSVQIRHDDTWSQAQISNWGDFNGKSHSPQLRAWTAEDQAFKDASPAQQQSILRDKFYDRAGYGTFMRVMDSLFRKGGADLPTLDDVLIVTAAGVRDYYASPVYIPTVYTPRIVEQTPTGAALNILNPASFPETTIVRNGADITVRLRGADALGVIDAAESIPHGFANEAEFNAFGKQLNEGLAQAGYGEAKPVFQGSSVTGKKFTTGAAFDVERVSDFDIALADPKLIAKAKELGIGLRSGGTRTGPLTVAELEKLGLKDLAQQLSKQAGGREINFMIFDTVKTATGRSPSIVVPK